MINYLSKPFKWFFKLEAASGLVLLLAAILALIVSNSSFNVLYFESLNKYCHYSKENVLSELDNYSNDNIKFHNQIMKLTKVKLMGEILESQLIHLQYLRKKFVAAFHGAISSKT